MRKSVPLLGAFLLAGAAAALEVAEAAASRAKATPHPDVIDDLVAANRILSDQGVVDGFGHVSVRHDTDPGRFLLARSMAPGLVSADDILEFDLDGNAIETWGRALYVERFIHSEIYPSRHQGGRTQPLTVDHSVRRNRCAVTADLPHELVPRCRRPGLRDP